MNNLVGILAVRAFGSIGNLFLLFFCAQLIGANSVGFVSGTLSTVFIISCILLAGVNKLALKNIWIGSAELSSDYAGVLSIRVVLLLGSCLIAFVIFVAGYKYLSLLAISGALLSQAVMSGDTLKAMGRSHTGVLLEVVILPYLVCFFVYFFAQLFDAAVNAVVVISILSALIVNAAVAWFVQLRTIKRVCDRWHWNVGKVALQYAKKNRMSIKNYWVTGILVVVSGRTTLAVAPIILAPIEASVAALIVTYSSLGGTLIHALQSIFLPKIVRALGRGDESRVRELYIKSRGSTFLAFLPFTILVVLSPKVLFDLFNVNPDIEYVSMLRAVVFAQQIRMLSGCCEGVMSLFNNGFGELALNAAALLIVIIFSFAAYLSPEFSLIVLLAGYALSLVVKGFLGVVLCRGYVVLKR